MSDLITIDWEFRNSFCMFYEIDFDLFTCELVRCVNAPYEDFTEIAEQLKCEEMYET